MAQAGRGIPILTADRVLTEYPVETLLIGCDDALHDRAQVMSPS